MKSLLLLGCVGLATAFRAANLINETHHTEESLKQFQAKMNELSEVQRQLFQRKNGGPKLSKRPTPPEVDINKEVQAKPDKLPYLFEGDIVLTDKQMNRILKRAQEKLTDQNGRSKRSLTNDLSERWTFPIPYYISTSTGVSESAVLAGIQKWQTDTCVTFSRQSFLPNSGHCLNFILGNGCYSYIGMQANPQQVSIGNGCTSLGTVTHEIGHALGFYHEQSRWDRDNYVTILTQNIQNIYLSQFTAVSESLMVDYGVPYDLGSVMHYDQYSFSDDNLQTIQTLDPNYQNTIGQRVAPSFADVKRINFAYSSCTNVLNCQNGGYTDPKNCQQCRCPDGFGGTLCDRAATGSAGCSAGDLTATSSLQTIQASGALNCPFVIKAPAGKKIFFQVGTFSFTNWPPCTYDYLEIKYKANQELTGARTVWTFFPQPATTTPAAPNPWTFFPQTTTPSAPSGCTQWQPCTAQCGGCGTTSRFCNGQWQTYYCNTQPCDGGFCCRPFRNRFGQCSLRRRDDNDY